MDGYEPHQDSTYALTLYRYNTEIEGKPVAVGDTNLFEQADHELFNQFCRFLGHCGPRTLRQPSPLVLLCRARMHPREFVH